MSVHYQALFLCSLEAEFITVYQENYHAGSNDGKRRFHQGKILFLANLGIINEPGAGRRTKNLLLAKQTIDVLAMLEEKTRGNLTQDEATMLKSILYDLRIIYVRELE